MVGWNSIYRDNDRQYPAARVMRAGINLIDDLKKKRPFYLGVDSFDPHEPFDAPKVFQLDAGKPKGIETSEGIIADPAVRDALLVGRPRGPRRRHASSACASCTPPRSRTWTSGSGRLMNKLADEKLLDETVVYYMSDHGLTLGENGVMGKDGARAQWHIYHVPALIRHPEGKLAGQTSDYFASTHDVSRTLLSFMGVRAPGMMEGEDLSVLFDGREPPPRPHFTSCYDNYLLCGDRDWFLLSDSEGRRKRLYDKRSDPKELHNVAAEHPQIVDRLWRILEDEAGGTLPQFGSSGARAVIGG